MAMKEKTQIEYSPRLKEVAYVLNRVFDNNHTNRTNRNRLATTAINLMYHKQPVYSIKQIQSTLERQARSYLTLQLSERRIDQPLKDQYAPVGPTGRSGNPKYTSRSSWGRHGTSRKPPSN